MSVEKIKNIEKEIKKDKLKTENDKIKFINQIKSGLGESIKHSNGVIVVKKSLLTKLKIFFKKLFLKL